MPVAQRRMIGPNDGTETQKSGADLRAALLVLLLAACVPAPGRWANPLGWHWQGRTLVCGQTMDFRPSARDDLPGYSPELRRGFCARVVRFLRLHRRYGTKTGYFGVTAMTTSGLAAIDIPSQRHLYSEPTWDFLAGLSGALEVETARAEAVANRGPLIGRALDLALFQAEQRAVQQALDALRARDETAHQRLVGEVNATLNPRDPLLLAALASTPFFANYHAALAGVRTRLGRDIDFARKRDRVAVALALAAMLGAVR